MTEPTFYQEAQSITQMVSNTNPEGFKIINDFEQELSEKEAFALALRKGAKIPDFVLPNAYGKSVSIRDLYQPNMMVLVFYRGQWCPFCNLYLKSLQKNLAQINNSPANLVAISPQTPDHSLETMQKLELNFEVLSDVGGEVGKRFNLIYTVPDFLHQTYLKFGIDIEQFNGKGKLELPYPATYIVNQHGVIIADFISTHPNERQEASEVIATLQKYMSN
jgi:peroxiredoxin